jgi:CBS domain containing-hemolysin-like protein
MSANVAGLIALVALLLVNAYFVAAEFSLVSARRSQIEPRAERGGTAAKTTLWAIEHVTLMLAATQLGITVCSLMILNVSEPTISRLLGYPLAAAGLPAELNEAIAFVIALIGVTFLHVVVGEMVPKNVTVAVPERSVLVLAPPLVAIGRVVRPLIWLLNGAANLGVRLFRVQPQEEATSAFTLDQVAGIVRESEEAGTITDPTGRLGAALAFTTRTVGDLVVPRAAVRVLTEDTTPAELQRIARESGYSRYLITNPGGQPIGYLHLKDVIDLDQPRQWSTPIPSTRYRRLIHISTTADAKDALRAMRAANSHLALSVDAAGTGTGVLFLEDVIEELVGRIGDRADRGPQFPDPSVQRWQRPGLD